MAPTGLLKQTLSQPLYPELLWSRPENKQLAGKLLVIGGNKFGFSAPAKAYSEALRAGIGEVRAILPDAIQKTVGGFFEHALFTPSTPSGSFGQISLNQILDATRWADGVLVAGDVGRNSETAVVMENFIKNYAGALVATKDTVLAFQDNPLAALDRDQTVLVITLAELQRYASASKFSQAFTLSSPLQQFVQHLQKFSAQHQAGIIVKRSAYIFVAYDGRVSGTQINEGMDNWRTSQATYAAVWLLQQPQKPFESLTSSVVAAFGKDLKID